MYKWDKDLETEYQDFIAFMTQYNQKKALRKHKTIREILHKIYSHINKKG